MMGLLLSDIGTCAKTKAASWVPASGRGRPERQRLEFLNCGLKQCALFRLFRLFRLFSFPSLGCARGFFKSSRQFSSRRPTVATEPVCIQLYKSTE